MKISIITVAYNSAATISDTLRSVASQSHPDIEHILVDGASSDSTLALIRADGAHVSTLISERDGGIYHAMNKGLDLATGEFVGLLNADDMLSGPQVLADIAQAGSDGDTDAVYGDLVYVKRDRPQQLVRYWRSGAFVPARLKFGWTPPHPTLYVRRTRLAELGLFDLRLRIAADYDFMLRYLTHPGFRTVYLPQVLVHMRMGGVSNRSIPSLVRKSYEDWLALRQNRAGGLLTLICKNARKLPQFITRPSVSR